VPSEGGMVVVWLSVRWKLIGVRSVPAIVRSVAGEGRAVAARGQGASWPDFWTF
jgi:hypothetical protein